MKVQLIVVQGKPEGKVIPLVGPVFKIGRGETCHLRPNSELVSREHAQFSLHPDKVTVQDLGSRNGTLVNGKALTEVHVLKDRDLVQVGALTFAISIQGAPVAAAKPAPAAPAAGTPPPSSTVATPPPAPAPKPGPGPDDVSFDDIESWLVGDNKSPAPERPSGGNGGDTITITAFRDGAAAAPPAAAAPADVETDEEYEREQEAEEEKEEEEEQEEGDDNEAAAEAPEEFVDESNPFFVKKKKEAEAAAKPVYKDTSDAASDILRRMLERRRAQKSS